MSRVWCIYYYLVSLVLRLVLGLFYDVDLVEFGIALSFCGGWFMVGSFIVVV